MKTRRILSIFFFTLFTSLSLHAQLYIDTTISVQQMMTDFFDGTSISVSNVVYTGSSNGKGYFEGATTDLGLPAGILLSTGMATDAIGPSQGDGTSTALGNGGDLDLENTVGMPTLDAAILEMDITSPIDDTLQFYYVFGSEEYNEFVGAGFNDVFAFLVQDPGTNDYHNIAMLPGQSIPVAIDFVNLNMNSAYYVDYVANGGQDLEFDGMTTELSAPFIVAADSTYHVKIAIGDVGDQVFDSGVFISVESLDGDSLLVPPAEASLSIDNNVLTIENESRYATSYHWNFGDGTISTERHPAPHMYQNPGSYTVQLITQNYCCSDTLSTSIEAGGGQPMAFDAFPTNGCAPLTVQFNDPPDASVQSRLWSFPGGVPAISTIPNPIVTYFNPGTFSVSIQRVTDQGIFVVEVTDMIEVGGSPQGEMFASVNGLDVDFSFPGAFTDLYFWTFGDGGTSNSPSPTHTYNAPGSYDVELMVSNACGINTLTQTVTVGIAPVADFTFENMDTLSCDPMTVQFFDTSTENPEAWQWQFPGGSPELTNAQNPIVTYAEPGNYDVTLTVTNDFGMDQTIQSDYIQVSASPDPSFIYEVDTITLEVNFINTSSFGSSFFWDFGDNSSSSDASPMHTYDAEGEFTVILYASNDSCGLRTFEQVIDVGNVSTNITELSFMEKVELAPNPSNGQFSLNLSGERVARLQLSLHNILGQSVYREIVDFSTGQLEKDFDFNELSPGTYFLQIQSPKERGSFKLVIRK